MEGLVDSCLSGDAAAVEGRADPACDSVPGESVAAAVKVLLESSTLT